MIITLQFSLQYWSITGVGGGITCHDFRYRRAAGVPGPHPIHILGEVKKKQTHWLYFPYRKVYPFIYMYYFSYFTNSYTFWVKKIPAQLISWYTFDVKMIPEKALIYLEAWKVYPFQPHVCIYLFYKFGSYPPPCYQYMYMPSDLFGKFHFSFCGKIVEIINNGRFQSSARYCIYYLSDSHKACRVIKRWNLWHVKRCNIWSFLFILYNFLFVLYNLLCVLYKTPFILYNFLFILYIFLFVLYNFHLYCIISYLYCKLLFILYNFSFVLYKFHSYCIISYLHCINFICIV